MGSHSRQAVSWHVRGWGTPDACTGCWALIYLVGLKLTAKPCPQDV